MDNFEHQTTGITRIPMDLFPDGNSSKEKVIFHYYTARPSAERMKSILHRNAISLVIEGEKKIRVRVGKVRTQ